MTQPVFNPIIDPLMRGNTTMRQLIENHLRDSMPFLIDVGRQQWSLDPAQLPYPTGYDATDPLQALDYPFVGSFATGADEFIRTDINASGSVSYDAVYEVTLFVVAETARIGTDDVGLPMWEKDERYSAMRQRDDLMAIMRSALLNTPSLGTASMPEFPYRARVREESIRESYTEPVKVSDSRNPRWVCSGLLSVDINLAERTVQPITGNVEHPIPYVISLRVDLEQ